jgi:hypothetical protein
VGVYFSAMFCVCMICHGELVALKPHPKYLTSFFLTISAGGAAGGLFVGLLAPLLFVSYCELNLGIVGFAMLFMCLRVREDNVSLPLPRWIQPILVPMAMAVAVGLFSRFGRNAEGSVAAVRNFYGVLRVEQLPNERSDRSVIGLSHGRIRHGSQFVLPEKRRVPTTYYSEAAGIGQLMNRLRPDQPRHVGIVGLGVGTLAAYGHAGDRFRLYEINPDVISMAQEHFSFLKDCPAESTIVTGDARLALEFEEPQQFDILVLDAFSGDAIPVHLLTKEAVESYLKHVKPNGVLAFHISNMHFDLRPIVAGIAEEFGLASQIRVSAANPDTAAVDATWALLARQPEVLADSIGLDAPDASRRKPIVWTDDRSNLFEVLR